MIYLAKYCLIVASFLLLTCNATKDRDTRADANESEVEMKNEIIIPQYKPLEVPFSKWEMQRSIELLEANGYTKTAEDWRRATQDQNGLIREAAFYLLTRTAEDSDERRFRQGLEDVDENVQVLAALGLYKLGDDSALSVIERLAKTDDVDAHLVATRAAGTLAQLGKAEAFGTIQDGLNSRYEYTRLFAMQHAFYFARLHGEPFSAEENINIWTLYEQALRDSSAQVRLLAKAQLLELNSKEALELLQKYK